MNLRRPEAADIGRIMEVAESSMTTSYRLSPQQIEAVSHDQFGEERLTQQIDSSEAVLFVAEITEETDEPVIVGFVEGTLDEPWGEVNWLFVDPEHRGEGIGTRLQETVTETLREEGAEHIRMAILEANTEGDQFLEQFGFEHTDERRIEVGDESLVEHVYTDPSVDVEPSEETDDADMPDTETYTGSTTATTEDGTQVFIADEEEESGTEGSFFVTYTDEEHTEKLGYYCSNCGSLETSVDNMDRIECSNCGNTHASRSEEAYDDSYL